MNIKPPWLFDGFNRVRLFYLLSQGAIGIYLPFINVFFESERGLSGRQIGLMATIAPLLTLLVAPMWGSIADTKGSRLLVLRWAMAGAAASIVLVGIPQTFWPLVLTVAQFTFFHVAILPLGDGVIASTATERGTSFGSLRLWGSLGFALGSVLFGQLLGQLLGLNAIFPAYALLMVLALPVTRQLVSKEPPPRKKSSQRGLTLLQDPTLSRFLLIAGLGAMGISTGFIFLFVFLGSLGASAGLLGIASATGAVAEVPFMLWGGRLIRRFGSVRVFASGMGLVGLAWILYAFLTIPILSLGLQMLVGAGMGLLLPAGVVFVASKAPNEQSATAQSLFSAVMYGIAPLLANPIAGQLYDSAGARAVMGLAGGFLVMGFLTFAVSARRHFSRPAG